MKTDFDNIGYPTRLFTEAELAQTLLRDEDKKLLIEVGLPTITPPNSLRFAAPASVGGKGLSLLSEEWARFRNLEMAQKCVVFASDSNGNSLFINNTPKGGYGISFYDHDFGTTRFVSASLQVFLRGMLAYLTFLNQKQSPNKEDFLAFAETLKEIEPLALVNPDTFWAEMVFYPHL